jgi:exosortase
LERVSQLVPTENSTQRLTQPANALNAAHPIPHSPISLWQISVLAVLTLFLYWSTLSHLVGQWWRDPNFSHGFFVPLFAVFVVWQERHRLAEISSSPTWLGLFVLAGALGLLITGQLGAELFLARFSFVLLLAGLILFFLGWNYFRALLFPWAFLLLMIPIPTILFNQITFPLQLQASRVAAVTLPLFGVPILREGNVIQLPVISLEVAEACSGIRSLMTLATLAIMYGYLMERRVWVRCLLAVASIPIAIVANSVRIIGTGLLVQYWDPDKAEGFFHASWGWIIFVLSLLILYALHSVIRVFLSRRSATP